MILLKKKKKNKTLKSKEKAKVDRKFCIFYATEFSAEYVWLLLYQ